MRTPRPSRRTPVPFARFARLVPLACTAAVLLSACGSSGGGSRAGESRASAAATSTPPSTTSTTSPAAAPVENVYAHTTPNDLSPAVAGIQPRVWVPNSEDDTVDVIDPATLQIVGHFPVGRLPQHV